MNKTLATHLRRFNPPCRVELTKTALTDGVTPEVIGGVAGVMVAKKSSGLITVRVDGQSEAMLFAGAHWKPVGEPEDPQLPPRSPANQFSCPHCGRVIVAALPDTMTEP